MELTPELITKYEMDEFNQSRDIPSLFHARLPANLSYAIKNKYKGQYDAYTELSLNVLGKEYVADVCV
jgi:hypothetical protein